MMNRQELLKACLEKIELYRDAVKHEYLGGMPLQVLLPELRAAISTVPEEHKLVALLREALEVLPGRGNLRRRIIQTLDHGSDMNKGS